MQSGTEPALVSKKALWIGRVISGLIVILMLFASVVKLLKTASVVQGFAQYGYPNSLIVVIGIIELICAVVYLVPQSSILGAILMTGLLGGATATNLRVGNPSWIAPVVVGVLTWGGLYLRDDRLRSLIPLRR